MDDVTVAAQALYSRFLNAWNGRDFEGVAACSAEPAHHVLPGADVPLSDRPTFVALFEKLLAGLEGDGFSHTVVGPIAARACGDSLAVVDAKDVSRRRKDGSAIEVIDGHNIFRRDGKDWFFIIAVTGAHGWKDTIQEDR